MLNFNVIALSVTRIEIEFVSDIGNPPFIVHGTGFWVLNNGATTFITNRHMVDSAYVHENYAKQSYKLQNIYIWVRAKDTYSLYDPLVKYK
jgi:hypothetical protein